MLVLANSVFNGKKRVEFDYKAFYPRKDSYIETREAQMFRITDYEHHENQYGILLKEKKWYWPWGTRKLRIKLC